MTQTLCLPLKAQWYEMIESGEKKEEYREITPYWIQRLMVLSDGKKIPRATAEKLAQCSPTRLKLSVIQGRLRFRHYDLIRFGYGYTRRQMYYPRLGIWIGKGRPEWGAPDHEVFIQPIGKRITVIRKIPTKL